MTYPFSCSRSARHLIMTLRLGVCALCLTAFTSSVQAQIPPGAKRFNVTEYWTIGSNGDYERFDSHGFYQPSVGNVKGNVYILPTFQRERERIAYIDEDGNPFRPSSSSPVARSIRIPFSFDQKMPGTREKAGFANAIGLGTVPNIYRPPLVRNNMGNPAIYPPMSTNFPLVQTIRQAYDQYEESLKQQEEASAKLDDYKIQQSALDGFSIEVVVDNEVVGSQSFPGSFVGGGQSMPTVTVTNPNRYVQNQIRNDFYDVRVKYSFLNSNQKFINARIDASAVMKDFLEETQRERTSSSSSGWQILGFGSRRKRIRSSLSNTVRRQSSVDEIENTTIEMFDADDDMIEQFEAEFFPTISQANLIQRHIDAAVRAENNGKPDLAKIHRDYAEAVRLDDPIIETDTEKALASLAAKDYFGFIANGFSAGRSSVSGRRNFRRVVTNDAEIRSSQNWSSVKRVSVRHSVEDILPPAIRSTPRGFVGLCDFTSNTFSYMSYNAQSMFPSPPMPINLNVVAPTCVISASPALAAGIVPGSPIIEVNGYPLQQPDDLFSALERLEAGDQITLGILMPPKVDFDGVFRHGTTDITITAKKGPGVVQ